VAAKQQQQQQQTPVYEDVEPCQPAIIITLHGIIGRNRTSVSDDSEQNVHR